MKISQQTKIIADHNCSFIYDRDGKLMEVIYLGKKKPINLSSIVTPLIESKKKKMKKH